MKPLVLGLILVATLAAVFARQWVNSRGAPNRLHATLFEPTPRQRERAANEAAHPFRTFVMIAVLWAAISLLFNSVDHTRTVFSIIVGAVLYALTMVLLLRYKQRHNSGNDGVAASSARS